MSTLTRIDLRIPPDVADIIDRLAEPHGDERGGKTAAIMEALRTFHSAARHAANANAEEFGPDDWALMAHSMPDADPGLLYDVSETYPADWSSIIAIELSDMYEGRAIVLQSHKDEQAAAKKLAKRVAKIGPMRGWALMDALRRFWGSENAPEKWWEWNHATHVG